jgi:hypothetical protein
MTRVRGRSCGCGRGHPSRERHGRCARGRSGSRQRASSPRARRAARVPGPPDYPQRPAPARTRRRGNR